MQESEVEEGLTVRALVAFPDVPQGSIGRITALYDRAELGQRGQGVEVTWQVAGDIIDAFAPHELKDLEVVHDDGSDEEPGASGGAGARGAAH
jgi:hypothetical protein